MQLRVCSPVQGIQLLFFKQRIAQCYWIFETYWSKGDANFFLIAALTVTPGAKQYNRSNLISYISMVTTNTEMSMVDTPLKQNMTFFMFIDIVKFFCKNGNSNEFKLLLLFIAFIAVKGKEFFNTGKSSVQYRLCSILVSHIKPHNTSPVLIVTYSSI